MVSSGLSDDDDQAGAASLSDARQVAAMVVFFFFAKTRTRARVCALGGGSPEGLSTALSTIGKTRRTHYRAHTQRDYTPFESSSAHLPTTTECLWRFLAEGTSPELSLAVLTPNQVKEDIALPEDEEADGEPALLRAMRHDCAAVWQTATEAVEPLHELDVRALLLKRDMGGTAHSSHRLSSSSNTLLVGPSVAPLSADGVEEDGPSALLFVGLPERLRLARTREASHTAGNRMSSPIATA